MVIFLGKDEKNERTTVASLPSILHLVRHSDKRNAFQKNSKESYGNVGPTFGNLLKTDHLGICLCLYYLVCCKFLKKTAFQMQEYD